MPKSNIRLARDLITSDGGIVGIYDVKDPSEAIYTCSPDKADKLVKAWNRGDTKPLMEAVLRRGN